MKIYLFSLFTLLFAVYPIAGLQAQNDFIDYSEPKEASNLTTDASEAKVIIISPNKDIEMSHTMGHEKGVLAGREKNGEYRFELTHPLSEDELEDGFCKTTVSVSTSNGRRSSMLVLKPGKCYVGSFRIPFKFSCNNESNSRAVFAEENRAKVSFISEIDDLTIFFNGKAVVTNGADTSPYSYVTVKPGKEKELTIYDLIFDTSVPEAQKENFKHPVFTLKSSFPEKREVQLGEGNQLSVKTLYRFRVLLHLVDTIHSEKEVFVSDYSKILNSAEQSGQELDYAAAKGFYLQALKAKDAPKDAKETLEKKISKMEQCEDYDTQAKRAMLYIRELKKAGQDARMDEIEAAFRQALSCYINLERLNSSPVYKELIEKTNKALEAFNIIVVEGTVRDKKNNTKTIAGISIYGIPSSEFTSDMEKKTMGVKLGAVDPSGKFRVEVEKGGQYNGLLFVPDENKDYKKNGFVSLKEQKHLKTTIYLYK